MDTGTGVAVVVSAFVWLAVSIGVGVWVVRAGVRPLREEVARIADVLELNAGVSTLDD